MTPPDETQDAPTRRRAPGKRTLAIATAAVAALALSASTYLSWPGWTQENSAGGEAAAGGTRSSNGIVAVGPRPDPAPNDAPGLANKPDVPTPLPPEQAKVAVKKYLDSSVAVNPAASGSGDDLTAAASGAILAEAQNDTQELEANGWTREGFASIEALIIVSSDTAIDPATVVAQACVDSSKVRTLDHDGKPVGSSGSTVQRALNIYTLQYVSGAWKVVARTFPDDPSC